MESGLGYTLSGVSNAKAKRELNFQPRSLEWIVNTTVARVLVTRLLFEGNRPVGVDYMNQGTPHQIRVNQEVILSAGAFDEFRGEEVAPGADIQSDGEIESHIRASCTTLYHPVGTCKMGIDSMAVVDPQLRVHAIEGLRVVDASIMPTLTTGNTTAPTIAIGEKAADLIKAAKHSSKQTRQTVTTRSSSQTLVGVKLPL